MIDAPTEPASHTTRDAFLGGAVWLEQPARGYRAGLDAVLLAASLTGTSLRGTGSIRPANTDRTPQIADLGAGVGAVGLCLARRLASVHVHLIEREPFLSELSQRNIQANSLGDRVTAIECDVTTPSAKHLLEADAYDHALANPPYYADTASRPSQTPNKAASHTWDSADLEIWARTMARIIRPNGTVTIVHPSASLPDWLEALQGRFGEIQVVPIHARQNQPALRVLIRARKASRAGLQLCPGLVLHTQGTNCFDPLIDAVLKAPGALDLWQN